MERTYTQPSPCIGCTRVSDPNGCDDKRCVPWRRWFVRRWDQMYGAYRRTAQVREHTPDPCESCVVPKSMCVGKCREKTKWEEAR